MRLTNKQKLSLNFAFVVFLFYLCFAGIFYFVARAVLVNELRKSLVEEGKEIIRNHLVASEGKIGFTKDSEGNFLKEELTDHGYSAIFLDTKFSLIRSFGLYEFYDEAEKENLRVIAENINKSNNKPFSETVEWRGKHLFSYFFPVMGGNGVLAYGVVSVDLEHIDLITRNVLLVLLGLGVFNFLGSMVLGVYLADKFLKPVRLLSQTVDKIDLDRLSAKLSVTGPPYDEFVILINKFNEMLGRIEIMAGQQQDFISNASHELKTPLARAILSIDVLSSAKEIDKEELNLIKNDLFEINSLLENLLVLSKLRKTTLKKGGRLIIAEFMQGIEKDYQQQLNEQKLKFEVDVKAGFEIFFPKDYLKVLITNLLSNAIKYSKERSTIFFRAYEMADKKIIEINDEGTGMSDEQRTRVFERFYRGKDAKSLEGHGIGMSLVKQICDLYGIGIKVNSKKGKGTEVALIFPR